MKKKKQFKNVFNDGNKFDGKHYWLTPPDLYAALNAEFNFDFDPCPYPRPSDFDGTVVPWGTSNYVNPPFGAHMLDGKKIGPTAWARKAIAEFHQGKKVVFVFPFRERWLIELMMLATEIRDLGEVQWQAIEDGSTSPRHGYPIACFVLDPAGRAK